MNEAQKAMKKIADEMVRRGVPHMDKVCPFPNDDVPKFLAKLEEQKKRPIPKYLIRSQGR